MSCQAGFVGKWMPQENTLEMMAQHYHKGIKKKRGLVAYNHEMEWEFRKVGISLLEECEQTDIYSLLESQTSCMSC